MEVSDVLACNTKHVNFMAIYILCSRIFRMSRKFCATLGHTEHCWFEWDSITFLQASQNYLCRKN